MDDKIQKTLGDLSMLLVMVDAADSTGLEAAFDLLTQLRDLAAADPQHPRLAEAARYAADQRSSIDNQSFISLLNSVVSAAQAYFNNPAVAKFPNETQISATDSEFAVHFDKSFLVEFIEKHALMLDEFEGAIVDKKFGNDTASSTEPKAFHAYIRSYLHNIKGDAGAIGLAGIERVTHFLEDMLTEKPAESVLEQLLAYKEWVISCIRAFSCDEPPKESSSAFLARFAESSPLEASTETPSEPTAKHAEEPAVPVPSTDEPAAVKKEVPPSPNDSYALAADTELLSEFAAEAEDHLNNIESILLESAGEFSPENIDTIFRGVHSLKGASSYFNLIEINGSSHRLENLLDEVRDGLRPLDQNLVALVFRYIDLQKTLLQSAKGALEKGGLIRKNPAVVSFLNDLEVYAAGTVTTTESVSPAPAPAAVAPSPEESTVSDDEASAARDTSRPKDTLGVKNYVKVDTARLDLLVDSIGEMVIYSSMLVRNCRELLPNNAKIQKTCHQVEKFSRDLQDIGMSMRLDPIKGLFQKMSRLVWDSSKKLKKEVQFRMKGEDTELDRTVIEKLADPLMHMVRNSLDHGIEAPDDRVRSGKPRAGIIELSASQEGGNIIIRVVDDGRGIDPVRIFDKAVEKGIVDRNQKLSQDEILRLIFAPGFSTAAVVTDISGRGVGMDVVRTNIESIRGRVRIQSEVGVGSTFVIELPLTLAIMDGIEATVGDERFIIPTLSVVELLRPTKTMLTRTMGKGETLLFRNKFIPLFRLASLYNIESKCKDPIEGNIFVLENSGEQVALLVDDILGSCQTVIKNLGSMFREGRGLSGCSIMPNGDIGLILDVHSLIQLARRSYQMIQSYGCDDMESQPPYIAESTAADGQAASCQHQL